MLPSVLPVTPALGASRYPSFSGAAKAAKGIAGAFVACCLLAVASCGGGGRTATVASPDGVRIAYSVAGSGDVTVVLVHGWSCDRSYWDHQVEALAQRYRVVRVDLAGHGESGLGRQSYTTRAFAKDVAAVVDAVGPARVVLVGHSMGGPVCVETARILPDRVVGVIGIDTLQRPTFGLTADQIRGVVAPFHADFPGQTDTFVRSMFTADADSVLVARIASDMAAAPPAVAISALSEHLAHDLAPALAELDLPIRCLNADKWPTDVQAWADYAGGFEVEIMPGVGHFLMIEKPDEFNRRLIAIIDNLAGGASAR